MRRSSVAIGLILAIEAALMTRRVGLARTRRQSPPAKLRLGGPIDECEEKPHAV
jgi:hypothetical protein